MPSKAVAQQMFARLLDEHRRLVRAERPRRTCREALDRFWADYLPTLKPASQRRYRASFRQLAAASGDLYLDAITRGRLAACDQPPHQGLGREHLGIGGMGHPVLIRDAISAPKG
jgi:hypothetical protein